MRKGLGMHFPWALAFYVLRFVSRLLYGDGFGQVARLVYVGSTAHGYFVGEQLERDGGEDGRQEVIDWREVDYYVRIVGNINVAIGGQGDHAAVAGFDLFEVA